MSTRKAPENASGSKGLKPWMKNLIFAAVILVLAAALCVCVLAPAASAATTMGGADTTLIPAEEENCLAWLFGTSDTITMPYLNIKGKGLQRNVTLNLVDCLVGITYTELGSIGSYVSASAAQQAWKAQAVAIHSYLEYHKPVSYTHLRAHET